MSTVLRITLGTIACTGGGCGFSLGSNVDFSEDEVLDHPLMQSKGVQVRCSQKQPPHLYDSRLALDIESITTRHSRYVLPITFKITGTTMQTNIDTLLDETYAWYRVYYNYAEDPATYLVCLLSRSTQQSFYWGEFAYRTIKLTFYECFSSDEL